MILCADDYGLRDDIDDAILELVDCGRLTAVSCMVVLEHCSATGLAELLKRQARVDIGLHFCLTNENLPLSVSSTSPALPPLYDSFGAVLRGALFGGQKAREIHLQVQSQYEFFLQKCGKRPDYIDGHLHVHQLPGVREALLNFVATLPPDCRPYIRNTRASLRELRGRRLPWLKAASIGFYGARIYKQLHLAGIPTNEGFVGIYDFRNCTQYPQYLPRFVDSLTDRNGIMVVHPGKNDDWRHAEFKALRGFAFAKGSLNRYERLSK